MGDAKKREFKTKQPLFSAMNKYMYNRLISRILAWTKQNKWIFQPSVMIVKTEHV